MDKISIIGIGKLGLCLALNLDNAEYKVTGIDINQEYIDSLNNKTFKSDEPHVNDYLEDCKIKFTTDIKESLKSDIIFVVVKTPSTNDDKYDHSQIEEVTDQLISFGKQDKRKELIINCTTYPGYCDMLHKKMKKYNYYVSYNPEFIAQGYIMRGQSYADTVLIGAADKKAANIISEIYKNFMFTDPVVNIMTRTEAELTKLAVNCFLTTKISYANMIGDIANRLNCDAEKILEAVGSDCRIGNLYLKPGFGYGGPCFPRDNRSLAKIAEEVGIDALVSKATDEMNKKHLLYQFKDYIKKHPDKNIPIEFEYLTYNKNSTSFEESQQLALALKLKEVGYKIIVKDKRKEVLKQLKNILE